MKKGLAKFFSQPLLFLLIKEFVIVFRAFFRTWGN